MKVKDVLDRLATVELSNLGLVDAKTNTIREKDLNKIINAINSSLTTLYTNFFLKESSIFIDLIDGKIEYILTSEHNVPEDMSSDYDHYIYKGYNQTFNDDIIKITEVTLNTGRILPINNNTEPLSVYIPAYNIIQVPSPFPCMELAVTYQANHPKVSLDNLEQDLELPESFQLALFLYTGYLVANSINSQSALTYGEQLYNKYNLVTQNLLLSSSNDFAGSKSNIKFIKNGWC